MLSSGAVGHKFLILGSRLFIANARILLAKQNHRNRPHLPACSTVQILNPEDAVPNARRMCARGAGGVVVKNALDDDVHRHRVRQKVIFHESNSTWNFCVEKYLPSDQIIEVL